MSLSSRILEAGSAYGTSAELEGHSFSVEFVSANPTGPLHIGHTRWAALGDSLVRVSPGRWRIGHQRVLYQ